MSPMTRMVRIHVGIRMAFQTSAYASTNSSQSDAEEVQNTQYPMAARIDATKARTFTIPARSKR